MASTLDTPAPSLPVKTDKPIKPTYKPGVLSYGCDHIRMSIVAPMNIFIQNYKMALNTICNRSPVRSQHFKNADGKVVTRLEPLFLCLQCDTTVPEERMDAHGDDAKHKLFVNSRNGNVYCNMCKDYVFDPTMEEIRTRKVDTGSNGNPRKRKPELHAELFQESTIREARRDATKQPCNTTSVRGIWNMGMSCYMTSVLEAMVHNPLLRNYYLSEGHKPATCHLALANKPCLSCNMDDMFQKFNNTDETTAYSAQTFLGSFTTSKKSSYLGLTANNQQDAHEFLNYLREELHEIDSWVPADEDSEGDEKSPTKRRKVDENDCKCVVHQTFYGKTSTIIKCQGEVDGKKCGYVSFGQPELFSELSLGLPTTRHALRTHNLEKCLKKEYFTEEIFERLCDQCGSNSAIKQDSIRTLPNVLCIQLKRFVQGEKGQLKKVKGKVSFPLKLAMLPYTDKLPLAKGYGATQHTLKARSTYHLQSVVVHRGETLETGHYVAYSKFENQWFQFDDHKAFMSTKSEVLNEEAYMLFYVIQALASTEEKRS